MYTKHPKLWGGTSLPSHIVQMHMCTTLSKQFYYFAILVPFMVLCRIVTWCMGLSGLIRSSSYDAVVTEDESRGGLLHHPMGY